MERQIKRLYFLWTRFVEKRAKHKCLCALLRYIMALEKIVHVYLEQTKKHNLNWKRNYKADIMGVKGKWKVYFLGTASCNLKRSCCLKIIVRNYGFHFSLTCLIMPVSVFTSLKYTLYRFLLDLASFEIE